MWFRTLRREFFFSVFVYSITESPSTDAGPVLKPQFRFHPPTLLTSHLSLYLTHALTITGLIRKEKGGTFHSKIIITALLVITPTP